MEKTNGNLFRQDELVVLTHWDKEAQKQVETFYPRVGGRLRLAHEDNETLSIQTQVVQYDGSIAIVSATCASTKGEFTGMGTSSVERDRRLSQSLLELAETRSIARALRFAGYGVEYCGAEEISHLENGNGNGKDASADQSTSRPKSDGKDGKNVAHIGDVLRNLPIGGGKAPEDADSTEGPGNNEGNGGNGSNGGNGGNGGNGNGRLTANQHKYILSLAKDLGMTRTQVNQQCLNAYGVALDFLAKSDASSLINELIAR